MYHQRDYRVTGERTVVDGVSEAGERMGDAESKASVKMVNENEFF